MLERGPSLAHSFSPPVERAKEVEVPPDDPGEVVWVAFDDRPAEGKWVAPGSIPPAEDRDCGAIAGSCDEVPQRVIPPAHRVREAGDLSPEKVLQHPFALMDLRACLVVRQPGEVSVGNRVRADDHPVVSKLPQDRLTHQARASFITRPIPREANVAAQICRHHVSRGGPSARLELGPGGLRNREIPVVERERHSRSTPPGQQISVVEANDMKALGLDPVEMRAEVTPAYGEILRRIVYPVVTENDEILQRSKASSDEGLGHPFQERRGRSRGLLHLLALPVRVIASLSAELPGSFPDAESPSA